MNLINQQFVIYYPIFIVIFLFCMIPLFKYIIKKIYWNKKVDLRTATLNDKWLMEAFQHYSKTIVASQYNEYGKKIKTKKGDYTVNYTNDVNQYCGRIIQLFCTGNRLSDDFRKFVEKYFYMVIKRKDLNTIFSSYKDYKESVVESNYRQFLDSVKAITPSEFFKIRSIQSGDYVGAYIIFNQTKQKPYVGQAKRVVFRINQHFTGHGNGDVYADYKYGDQFYIKMISLADSGYLDLDLLEKELIKVYHANEIGYNKTKGNN